MGGGGGGGQGGREGEVLATGIPISIPEFSGFFDSGWSPGETLGKSNKISDWLFRVTTYCFAPEILGHFHSIVPESLQATNR